MYDNTDLPLNEAPQTSAPTDACSGAAEYSLNKLIKESLDRIAEDGPFC